jgi:hypothetical protein
MRKRKERRKARIYMYFEVSGSTLWGILHEFIASPASTLTAAELHERRTQYVKSSRLC